MSEMVTRYPINLSLHTVDDAALIVYIESLAKRKMLASTICAMLVEKMAASGKTIQPASTPVDDPKVGEGIKPKVKFIDDD